MNDNVSQKSPEIKHDDKIAIEQYKVIRSAIKDLHDDRNINNRFLIGIATALIGMEGYFFIHLQNDSKNIGIAVIISIGLSIIPILGIYLCNIWIKWNNTYGVAVKVRYDLLRNLEEHFFYKAFTEELVLRNKENYVTVISIISKLAKAFRGTFLLLFIISLIIRIIDFIN